MRIQKNCWVNDLQPSMSIEPKYFAQKREEIYRIVQVSGRV